MMRFHYRYKSLFHFLKVQHGITYMLLNERDFAAREQMFEVLDDLLKGIEQAKRELLVIRFDDPPPSHGRINWNDHTTE